MVSKALSLSNLVQVQPSGDSAHIVLGDSQSSEIIMPGLSLDTRTATTGQVPTWNASNKTLSFASVGTGGALTFIGLTDTPSAFTSAGGQFVKVNPGATALEFQTLNAASVGALDSSLAFEMFKRSENNPIVLSGNGSTSGVTVGDGSVAIRTGTGSVAQIDLYCEVNNLHKVSIKPPLHANYSGDVTLTLPNTTGTIAKTSDIPSTTSALPEGSNQYFTNARADARIAAANIGALSNVDTTGAANGKILKYDGTNWIVADDDDRLINNTTDDLAQGSTNLYYSNARVQLYLDAVAGHILPTATEQYDLGSENKKWRDLYLKGDTIVLGNVRLKDSGGNLSIRDSVGQAVAINNVDSAYVQLRQTPQDFQYVSLTGKPNIPSTTDSISEGANQFYTAARVQALVDSAYVTSRAPGTTDSISEGGNLYFTNARVQTLVDSEYVIARAPAGGAGISLAQARAGISVATGPASGGGAVTYNNATGEINFTPASVAGSTAIDSAQAIGIVDSNYVAARQDKNYNSLINRPTTIDSATGASIANTRFGSNIAVTNLSTLANVSGNAPGTNQALVWSGSEWAPADQSGAGFDSGGIVSFVDSGYIEARTTALTVIDDSNNLPAATTALKFVGAGVSASGSGATKTITISGGGSGVTVQDSGSSLSGLGTTLNFTGTGVTATGTGNTKTITINSSGGGGGSGDITAVNITAGTGLTGSQNTASGDHTQTLAVDVGTTANKIVQLDGTGKLPAIDGSQLTNLPGGGGGEANQNAFSTIQISGQSNVVADNATDTLTFAAGSGVTLTTDASTDTITIGAPGTGLSNIVEDTTPQLGGNLDMNTKALVHKFYVGNNGSSHYTFSAPGHVWFDSDIGVENDPTLYLRRGEIYQFQISASGHPFWIKTSPGTGTGNAYTTGITNNGTQNGLIEFRVRMSAPSTLYYNCQYHSAMAGTINIV